MLAASSVRPSSASARARRRLRRAAGAKRGRVLACGGSVTLKLLRVRCSAAGAGRGVAKCGATRGSGGGARPETPPTAERRRGQSYRGDGGVAKGFQRAAVGGAGVEVAGRRWVTPR